MKKFLRNLFSGYFLVLLLLLVELGAFICVQFYLDDFIANYVVDSNASQTVQLWVALSYIGLRAIIFIVAVIIFFKIINREEDPEFKIPWIVGMLLLPFFFSVCYIIFGNHGLRKRDKIIVSASVNAYRAHFESKPELKEIYSNEVGHADGAFKYIHNITKLGVHKYNKVKYYKCGEEFFPDLLEGLKQAEHFIFMEFFIISDGQEWEMIKEVLIEKAKAGVDVRVIYDDMGCSGTISPRTPKILAQYGISVFKFHPFRPILSGVYNNRDHRKIVIIDHKMAFTGGINLADEYANKIVRFGYWKDTMVRIQGSAINNLLVTFLQNFNLCTGVVSDYNKYLFYEYEKYEDEGYVMPFGDGPGGIDNALIGEQTYINILNYAKTRIDISTPYLIPTYGLLDAMRNAALRGVEVNLIVPGIPDKKIVYAIAQSNFKFLLDAGVNIYIYKPGFNHMKTCIADGKLGFVGTINFDFRSLVHHFECGVLLYQCRCMKHIQADFEEMIKASEKVPKNFKLKRSKRALCNLLKIVSPLF